MAGRGVLPLAVLIAATFIAGVTTAVIRVSEEDGPEALPTTESPSPTATSPSPEPTEEPTEEPGEEPTEEPGDGEVAGGAGSGGGGDAGELAETGAETLLFYLWGGALIGLAGALWRLSRRPID